MKGYALRVTGYGLRVTGYGLQVKGLIHPGFGEVVDDSDQGQRRVTATGAGGSGSIQHDVERYTLNVERWGTSQDFGLSNRHVMARTSSKVSRALSALTTPA